MNIRLDVVLRDITGKSGIAMIKAILAGECDPAHLASLVDSRVKTSKVEITNSLHGQLRDDLLFELKSCLRLYEIYEKSIVECNKQIEAALITYTPIKDQQVKQQTPSNKASKKAQKHSPTFNVQKIAFSYFKTDLFEIPGLRHGTVPAPNKLDSFLKVV